jgi:Mechanosensitive ion channel
MFNFSIPTHLIAYGACFVLYVLFEVGIRSYKTKLKKEYHNKKELIHSSEDAERVSLEHFNKLQTIDVARIITSLFFLMIVLSIADVRTFSFLAVTIGAIIISLRDYIISLISYVYVLANFDIGDDVKIVTVLGEIVRVRPLTTSIAGKDEHGDFDGGLHHIPNSKFITEVVQRQEIKNNNYRRVTLQALYSNELFKDGFSLWLTNLKEHLDIALIKRSLKDVGNYKSYAGIKYKLHYDYNDDGEIVVSISFISRTKHAVLRKEEIIEYIENTKRVASDC